MNDSSIMDYENHLIVFDDDNADSHHQLLLCYPSIPLPSVATHYDVLLMMIDDDEEIND